MNGLVEYGWGDFFARQVEPSDEGLIARVVAEHRGAYRLWGAEGECGGVISGRMRHHAGGRADFPVVGDWVRVRDDDRGEDKDKDKGEGKKKSKSKKKKRRVERVIESVLERRSCFSRKAAGETTEQQIVAANVDVVWIVTTLGEDLSIRRIERYLAMGWESGASPVVVLNKADVCDDPAAVTARVESVSPETPVHAVSAITGWGIEALRVYLRENATVALLGSSGVGKSTLVNQMVGEDVQATGSIREADGKGRHTTTARQLVRVPSGGLILDTPGMRELQLWEGESGVKDTFTDVEELAGACRFSDCAHSGEPDCAVAAAIASGELEADRLASYVKLRDELAHMERKRDARLALEEKKKMKAIHRALRDHPKYKGQ